MAVDGSLIFNTKIDTDGIIKGEKDISSKMIGIKSKMIEVQNRAKALKAELERTGNVKIRPQMADEIEKNIADAESKLKDFDRKMASIRQNARTTVESVGGDDRLLGRMLAKDSEYQQAKKAADEYRATITRLKRELEQINNAAPMTKDTAAYREEEAELERLSMEYAKYEAQLREAEQAQSGASRSTVGWRKHLQRTVTAMKMLGNGAKRAGQHLKTAFSRTVGKLISNIGNHFRKANNSTNVLEKSLRRIKNTLVRMFFFRLVHSPIDAIKDGLGEIAKISPAVNKNLSALKTESTYLKNSFAALAAPLVNLVTPALTSFMQTISGVLNQTGQLIAVLTGQSGFTQAVKVQQDYAASLDDSTKSTEKNTKAIKENQKALAGFDELNVLDVSESEGSGDSAATAPMFENVEAQAGGLAKKLVDLFKGQNFDGAGELVGEKINSALKKIKWDKIKTTVKGWASNIAGFFNGFIRKTDWNLVGSTIAEGLGTALLFAHTLISKFDFSEFGIAVGNLINGLLSPENAALFAETASELLTGIFDALINAVNTISWEKVGSVIVAFITNFNLEDVIDGATRFLNAFADAITRIDFKNVGNAFINKLLDVDWEELWDSVVNLYMSVLQGAGDFLGFDIDTSNLKKSLQNVSEPFSNLFLTIKNSFGELLTPIVKDILPSIVKFIGNIVKSLSPIIKTLAPVILMISDAVPRIMDALGPVLPVLGQATANLITLLTPILDIVIQLITKLVEALSPALSGIFAILGQIFEQLTPFIQIAMDVISPIIDVIGGIITALSGVIEFIGGIFTGDWEMAWDGIKNIFSGTWDAILGIVKSVWESIKSVLSTSWEFIKGIWNGVVNFFSAIWNGIKNVFQNGGSWFKNIFEGAWNGIKNIWNDVTGFFKGIWNGIKNAFTGVGAWFSGIFVDAVEGIKTAWDGIATWFQTLWDGICAIIKAPINAIISGFNGIIDGLNSISFDIPDWVPFVGGKHFGIDLDNIPELASGAYIPANYGEFLAVLGDNKREAEVVSPLSAMKQAFLEALAERGGSDQPQEINLYVDGDKFFNWLVGKDSQYQKTHGQSAFKGAKI